MDLNFLNQNAGALSVMFSGVVMVATVVYAILTVSLVIESKRMREAQTEPRMEITAAPREEFVGIITLRVKNIGLGPAYNIGFVVRGETLTPGENVLIEDFLRSQFLSKGLRYLGPGQEIQSHYTQLKQNFAEKIKARLAVDVTYRSASGKGYKNTIPIHFEEFEGYGAIGKPHLYSIAESLQKIEQSIHHLETGFRRLSVDTYSHGDRQREREEWEKRYSSTTEDQSTNTSA